MKNICLAIKVYHGEGMNTSIFVSLLFLLAFLLNQVFGSGIENFWDFVYGVCLTLAVTNLAPLLLKYLERKNG